MDDVREHLTEGINRQRVVLELRRSVRPGLVTLAGVAVGLLLAGYIAAHVSRTFLASTTQLRFSVADATGVLAGSNEVRYKGVVAGTITKLDLNGGRPVLTVKLKGKYGTLYNNARAELRPNTPLQDMYLNITDRGDPSAGKATYAHPLPPSQTHTGVNLDDVLGVFRAPVRARMATLLDQMGNGLADHGQQLRALLVELRPLLQAAGTATEQLDQRRNLVKHLVRNVGLLTEELSYDQAELARLVTRGSETVATLEDGSSDLASILQQLPPTLTTANSSFEAVRGVLGDVDDAVTELRPVVGQLPQALTDLQRLSAAGRPAVEALQKPVDKLRPLVNRLRPVSAELDNAVNVISTQTQIVDKVSTGLAKCSVPLQRFFQWNASFTKYGDVRAPSPRGQLVLGLTSSGNITSPFEYAPVSCTGGSPIAGRPARDEDGR